MKFYLLTAGEHYYPEPGSSDWIECFETEQEALDKVTKIVCNMSVRPWTFSEEPESFVGNYSGVKINGRNYDWYQIVDLRDWIYGKA